MNESCMSLAYEEGVEQFLQFASERSRLNGDKIFFSLYKIFERETENTRQLTGASVV